MGKHPYAEIFTALAEDKRVQIVDGRGWSFVTSDAALKVMANGIDPVFIRVEPASIHESLVESLAELGTMVPSRFAPTLASAAEIVRNVGKASQQANSPAGQSLISRLEEYRERDLSTSGTILLSEVIAALREGIVIQDGAVKKTTVDPWLDAVIQHAEHYGLNIHPETSPVEYMEIIASHHLDVGTREGKHKAREEWLEAVEEQSERYDPGVPHPKTDESPRTILRNLTEYYWSTGWAIGRHSADVHAAKNSQAQKAIYEAALRNR